MKLFDIVTKDLAILNLALRWYSAHLDTRRAATVVRHHASAGCRLQVARACSSSINWSRHGLDRFRGHGPIRQRRYSNHLNNYCFELFTSWSCEIVYPGSVWSITWSAHSLHTPSLDFISCVCYTESRTRWIIPNKTLFKNQ